MSILKSILTGLAVSGLFCATLAQEHHHATVQGIDYAFESPATLQTGYVTVTFTNDGDEIHHWQLARLNDGLTVEDFQAAVQAAMQGAEGPDAIDETLEFVGGVAQVMPGESATTTLNLEKPGTYLQICFVLNADGVPHLALGMLKPLEVVAANTEDEAPTADVTVTMHDFAFSLPASIPAGEQVWEVVNHGQQAHELALGKLKKDITMDDVRAFLQSGAPIDSSAEMPFEFIGGAGTLDAELSNFVTFDLEPGEYVTLCFVPDAETRLPHVALGMLSHFVVEETTAQN